MNPIDDHALMLKVKAGDFGKLNLLYARYSRRFFGFFYGMTKDGATSEDLVQNVFERILKYKHTYSEDGDFEVWAFRLARNIHHDHYKKEKRYSFQDDMEPWEAQISDSSTTETQIEKGDELKYLQLALEKLSDDKRELIEMVRFQKVKYASAADIMGLTESAVKVRVHRIMKELKELYLKLDV